MVTNLSLVYNADRGARSRCGMAGGATLKSVCRLPLRLRMATARQAIEVLVGANDKGAAVNDGGGRHQLLFVKRVCADDIEVSAR